MKESKRIKFSSALRPSRCRCAADHRSSEGLGFTIIEIMIVVAVIGVLAIMAIPSFVNARRNSQNASFMNTLRVLSSQLELYSLHAGKGDYPPDAPVATEPAGFGGYGMRGFTWDEVTPIGGRWDWDRGDHRGDKVHGFFYAGISVINPSRTSKQMEDIDAKVDDGILAQGNFRQHASGYIYKVEQ